MTTYKFTKEEKIQPKGGELIKNPRPFYKITCTFSDGLKGF